MPDTADRNRHPSLLLALVLACAGDGDSDGNDGASADVSPESGVWSYVETGVSESTCGTLITGANDDGPFVIENHGDGTLTVNPQDGTIAFECTIAGDTFDCSDRIVEEIPVQGYMATAIVHARVHGTFETETTGAGTQQLTVSCEGSDCAVLVAALEIENPCVADVAFTMDFTG